MERVNLHSSNDEESVLVITHIGKLRKLVCPFRVMCVKATRELQKNSWYMVTKVGWSNSGICYYINGQYYVYRSFHIYIMR